MVNQDEVTTSSTMESQLVSCNFAPKPKSSPDWLALAHLWSFVLSGIQQPHDIAAVRAACKTLRDYMDEHVKTLSIKQLNRISHQWARNLQSLAVSSDSDLSLLALCTNLQSLSLKSTPASVTALSTLTCLTSLELTPSQWDSLDLLSTCTRLQHLQLSGLKRCWLHHLDISALQALTNLTSLSMHAQHQPCADHTTSVASHTAISPLSFLQCLRHLSLQGSTIADITLLQKLTLLTSLDISNTPVSSLLPLSKCTRLGMLFCCYCRQLQSIAGLEACSHLQHLLISGTAVADVSQLAACSALMQVHAADTLITDIDAIAACTGMLWLNISRTQVSDISVVSMFSSLRSMNLSKTPVADVTPLAACTQLKQLEMLGSHVTDLSPVSALSSLTAFKYGDREPLPAGSAALDLQALGSCKQLKEVELHGNRINNTHTVQLGTQVTALKLKSTQVRHLQGIQAYPSLSSLHLDRCPIRSLQPLAACANLQTVHADNLKIRNLDGLQHCAKLETIEVLNCPVRDIGVLSCCHSLHTLTINNCPLSDIKAIAACRKLKHLNLATTQVKTIHALKHCTALQSVDISNTRVRDARPLAVCPHLKTLTVTEGCLYHSNTASTPAQIKLIPKLKSTTWRSLILELFGFWGLLLLLRFTIMCIRRELFFDPSMIWWPWFAWVVLFIAMVLGYRFTAFTSVQQVCEAMCFQNLVSSFTLESASMKCTLIYLGLLVVATRLAVAIKQRIRRR